MVFAFYRIIVITNIKLMKFYGCKLLLINNPEIKIHIKLEIVYFKPEFARLTKI